MILTGPEIIKQVHLGRIQISPFNEDCVTTNSYDVALHDVIVEYEASEIDPRKPTSVRSSPIASSGLRLRKHDFVLACTHETIGSDFYVPMLHARSSFARLGLFAHITADLIDIGSHGRLTLQLFAVRDMTIHAGDKLAQVTFWRPEGEIELYKGKYQGSQNPMPSEAYRDA